MNPRYRSAALLVMVAAAMPASGKDLRILVSNIESDRGEINCLLFANSKGFPQDGEEALAIVTYPAAPPLLTCTFPAVEPGRYAVSVMHDENGNKEVDTNFLGFSKEPWGATNNVRPPRRSPTFLESMITVSERAADFEVSIGR